MNMRIDIPLLERIAAILAPYQDDEETYLDTLDGETDVLALIDREISSEANDRAMADAISKQIADLKSRKDRIEMRADAHRSAQKLIMQASGLKKLERPCATLSLRAGSISVNIIDATAIPSQLCTVKTISAPDKAAIRAQIEAGEDVPGAELTRGDETLSVRVK